jgi:integrase
MATVFIQKRKRKERNSYVLYYKDPGTLKLKYFKTFQRLKDANNAAHGLRALLDTGVNPETRKRRATLNFLTFREICEQLNREWKRRLEVGGISQKTFDEYAYMLKSLSRIFGKRLLCEVSEDDILVYRSRIAFDLSNVSSNRHLFVIKQVFKQGIKVHAIVDNVAAPISYLSEKGHVRNRFLLPSELDKLVGASRKGRSRFYLPALIYLGAEHGASRQEALSLKWSDIDFEYEGQGIIKFFRTKNKKERTEYLMPRTRQALHSWREHLQKMRTRRRIAEPNSDNVFCRSDGTPIKRFDRAWRVACDTAGIRDFRFHDLRHTFCSNLLLAGSGLKDVKEMIGHSDLSMTDRYSHLTLDHKRIQQTRLAAYYSQ